MDDGGRHQSAPPPHPLTDTGCSARRGLAPWLCRLPIVWWWPATPVLLPLSSPHPTLHGAPLDPPAFNSQAAIRFLSPPLPHPRLPLLSLLPALSSSPPPPLPNDVGLWLSCSTLTRQPPSGLRSPQAARRSLLPPPTPTCDTPLIRSASWGGCGSFSYGCGCGRGCGNGGGGHGGGRGSAAARHRRRIAGGQPTRLSTVLARLGKTAAAAAAGEAHTCQRGPLQRCRARRRRGSSTISGSMKRGRDGSRPLPRRDAHVVVSAHVDRVHSAANAGLGHVPGSPLGYQSHASRYRGHDGRATTASTPAGCSRLPLRDGRATPVVESDRQHLGRWAPAVNACLLPSTYLQSPRRRGRSLPPSRRLGDGARGSPTPLNPHQGGGRAQPPQRTDGRPRSRRGGGPASGRLPLPKTKATDEET